MSTNCHTGIQNMNLSLKTLIFLLLERVVESLGAKVLDPVMGVDW
jgi:hypothetical protein